MPLVKAGKLLGALALLVAVAAIVPAAAFAGIQTFYPKTVTVGGHGVYVSQEFKVPAEVSEVTIDAIGAAGGAPSTPGNLNGIGSPGGRAQASFPVSPGQILAIYVGSAGTNTPQNTAGFNGGGTSNGGFGGGGASDVRSCGAPTCPTKNILIIAGGGGGDSQDGQVGGMGGDVGADGSPAGVGGGGGSQSAGGAAGAGNVGGTRGSAGLAYQGGEAGTGGAHGGGGGGGGYFGGGGGGGANTSYPGGGGGGGSSWGPVGTIYGSGIAAADPSLRGGEVTISWDRAKSSISAAVYDVNTKKPWAGTEVTGASAYGTATVEGGGAVTPTGTVTYSFYPSNDCGGAPTKVSTETLSAGKAPASAATGELDAGTYSFNAVYWGDETFLGSESKCETFTVGKASQTISFTAPTGHTLGDPDFDPGATASSGLAVSYTSQSESVCTIVSGKVHLVGAGKCEVTAEQGGNSNYEPAADAQRSFSVAKVAPTLGTTASSGITLGAGKVNDTASLSGGNSPTGTITFKLFGPDDSSCAGPAAYEAIVSVTGNGSYESGEFTPTAAGSYRWIATYSGDANNEAEAGTCGEAGESVIVAKASPTLSTEATGPVGVGATVKDTATLASGVTPGGTITFKLYGPEDSGCQNAPAYTSGPIAVSANGSYESGEFTTAEAGTYYWTAEYSGDSNNSSAASACEASRETSVVNKAAPTLSTTASSGVTVGGKVKDTATLTGSYSAGGTVTFKLYGPDDTNCTGAIAFQDTEAVAGAGAVSAEFTPTAAGTYRWIAAYSGDANNDSAAATCNGANESVTVAKAAPTISTTPGGPVTVGATLGDEAIVAGRVEPQAGATVTFKLYGPADPNCAGAPVLTSTVGYPVGGGAVSATGYNTTEAGTYHWSATYSGDANNEGADSTCAEASTVTKIVPTLNTSASAGITIGAKVSDTANLAGGFAATGTVTFKLYGPDDATCAAAPAYTSPKVSVTGDGSYESGEFTPIAAGTYRWVAEYSGDANNEAEAGTCGEAGESVIVAKASPTLSTTPTAGVTVGAAIEDKATVGGSVEPLAGATVKFELYPPGDPTCAGTPIFVGTVASPVGAAAVSSGTYATTQAGTYHWSATYSGDANNEGAGSTCAAEASTVAKAVPTVVLAAPGSSLPGQPVTVTASVGGFSATGTVAFRDGGSTLGSAALNGARQASLTTSSLAPGSHQITASYGGDANNATADSLPVTVVVAPLPKTTVRHSPNTPHKPNRKGGPRWTFVFADEAPSVTFYCRLDKAPFKRCHSPRAYRHLKRGRHVFRLKSVDAAGNVSPVQVVHFFVGSRHRHRHRRHRHRHHNPKG